MAIELDKLASEGLVGEMSSGNAGLKVYLQVLPRLTEATFEERRQILEREFAAKADDPDIELEPDTLSVTGQTIDALVNAEAFETLSSKLETEGLSVTLARWHELT